MALADPVKHIGEPGLRVHIVELGGLQQGVNGGGAFPAAVDALDASVAAAHLQMAIDSLPESQVRH